jgi:hypothetical protein
MVKLDLRKLSAPIEALRSDVDAAYKRLDAKWEEIADHLRALPIPCTIGYTFSQSPYGQEYCRLEWRKFNGKRRICIVLYSMDSDGNGGIDESETTTPYEEWSGEQRVEMLEHVPNLFDAAAKQVQEFVKKTET